MSVRLITIPFSHYCEKARWALERAGIEYREEGHLPLFSRLGGLRHGRWSTVPLLIAGGQRIADSTAILGWIDARGERWRPYPTADAATIATLEERFGRGLGPHARRVIYHHILADRAVALDLMSTAAVPSVERTMVRAGFPLVVTAIRKGLRIDEAGVERSLARIDEVFDEVAAQLADGRRFLVGDRFTAADLTFAAMAAPLVAPEGYGAPLPDVARLPDAAQELIARMRGHAAGRFALRLYEEERRAFS